MTAPRGRFRYDIASGLPVSPWQVTNDQGHRWRFSHQEHALDFARRTASAAWSIFKRPVEVRIQRADGTWYIDRVFGDFPA